MLNILITGITGQDGSNMARFLLKKFNNNVNIIGCYNNEQKLINISDIIHGLTICKLNLNELEEIDKIIYEYMPDYIFNFSSAQPQFETNNINFFKTNTLSTIQFLESIVKHKKTIHYFSAGSSLEYKNDNSVVDLTNNSEPNNIYGITKLSNRLIVNYYREKYNIFAIHAILFNHDSVARSNDFISQKIINHLKYVKQNLNSETTDLSVFEINNIFTFRDWSDSRDFIEAIWLMVNHDEVSNYILSSGKEYSICDFINVALNHLNFDNYEWKIIDDNYCLYYNKLPILKSLSMVSTKSIIGNNKDTISKLNWKPKISFEQMVKDMIDNVIY